MQNIMKSSKYDKDFDGIKWAIQARSNDETRPNVQAIKIESGVIIATDGHRLHMATIGRDIADGVYNIVKESKDMIVIEKADVTFPDYERVFPSDTHNGIPDLSTHTGSKPDKDLHMTIVLNHILRNSQNRFPCRQLLDACPMDEDLHFDQSGTAEDNRPLVIRNIDYTKAAVVMPLRD